VVDEVRCALGALVADEEPTDRPPGGGVDGGELPDGAHALELAHVEGVQGHQIPWSGGEVAEPERPLLGRLGEQAAAGGGDLGQGGHPLGSTAEVVADQYLLDSRGRQGHVAFGQVLEQAAGAEGGPGHRFGQHDLDGLRWQRVGHRRRAPAFRHERGDAIALGSGRPAVVGGAADPEGSARLGDRGLPGAVEHTDASVIDDLVKGHGGGLQFFGRNQRIHHRDPLSGGPVPPQLVYRKV
jgi:hypothetical protein